MTFEEWLFEKSKVRVNRDIVNKFASVAVYGQLALDWPVPITSLEQLNTFIDSLPSLTDERRGEVKFAARTAWGDYQKDLEMQDE